jgi:hypothetical protein
LQRRLERAAVEGDLGKGADCAQLARYLAALCYGIAVQCAGDAWRAAAKRE